MFRLTRLSPLVSFRAPRFTSNWVSKRDHHSAAAGALHTFADPKEIQRLTAFEPTLVSTYLSEQQAHKANPELPKIVADLEKQGHKVAFNVDLTKLHTPDPHVAAMMETAKKYGIDMSTLSVSFLRSHTEKPSDDLSLIASTAKAAKQSGVKKMIVTHSLAKFGNTAPSEKQWVPEAVGAGFQHLETVEERRSRLVESVPRPGDEVEKLRVNTVGVSTFTSE